MFIAVGVLMAMILAGVAAWIFYTAGNRGQKQDAENRVSAAKGRQTETHVAARAEGRGDL